MTFKSALYRIKATLVAFLLASLTISNTYAVDPANASERSSGKFSKALVHGNRSMVVTNNPLASKVADDVLLQGGTATDAAIAEHCDHP